MTVFGLFGFTIGMSGQQVHTQTDQDGEDEFLAMHRNLRWQVRVYCSHMIGDLHQTRYSKTAHAYNLARALHALILRLQVYLLATGG